MARFVNMDPDRSIVAVQKTTPAANGIETNEVSITLYKTDAGEEPSPLVGALPTFAVSGSGNVLTQPGPTDRNGTTVGSYTSTETALKIITGSFAGLAIEGTAAANQGGTIDPTPPGEPFFSDEFAGVQKNPSNGFTYGGVGSRVTVVTFGGFNCLRFRYGPDADGADSAPEQRFNMGRTLSELWLEYYIYIPANFVHRSQAGATNNKFLSLWPLNYSTPGDTYMVVEYERIDNTDSQPRLLSISDSWAAGMISNSGDRISNDNFVSLARAGVWTQVRVHFKIASGPGQTDGINEGWLDGVQQWRSRTDWVFWSTGGNNFIQQGYLMGWANSGYTAETDFHIRSLKFYETDPGW